MFKSCLKKLLIFGFLIPFCVSAEKSNVSINCDKNALEANQTALCTLVVDPHGLGISGVQLDVDIQGGIEIVSSEMLLQPGLLNENSEINSAWNGDVIKKSDTKYSIYAYKNTLDANVNNLTRFTVKLNGSNGTLVPSNVLLTKWDGFESISGTTYITTVGKTLNYIDSSYSFADDVEVDYTNKIVYRYGTDKGEKVSDFLNKIIRTNDVIVKILNKSETEITGDTLLANQSKIKINIKSSIDEYKVIVYGDANNNGKIDIGDVARTYSYVTGTNRNANEDERKAMDVTRDNDIKINDVSKLYSYQSKTITSLK